MKLADRSPLWRWKEIVEWLYQNNSIDKKEVKKAMFLENINVVLEERDPEVRKSRQKLLEEFGDVQPNGKHFNGGDHLNYPQ